MFSQISEDGLTEYAGLHDDVLLILAYVVAEIKLCLGGGDSVVSEFRGDNESGCESDLCIVEYERTVLSISGGGHL